MKFLQLQTRMGSSEAVVPLLRDSQNDRSELHPGPRSHSNEDNVAFDQEIAHLMENNMTMAMKYLQSKGLYLLPIGTPSLLSAQKGTPSSKASQLS
ncbi:bHLH transcription factor RHL1-like [Hordeum vulgare subsp. vulgare]|uniref:Uncharacterized protein n=1 Tax=Hordeum vulgare subsp. vulgare TaxID=112509 RepID=A0A8I6YB08_HORVV|nr:bHLH transcription factor RHL1-like [Hordeum vulgare subsp. vulgare]